MSKIADKVVDVCQFCHIYYEDKVDEGSLDLYNIMETESTKTTTTTININKAYIVW